MASETVTKLLEVFGKLNEPNRFAVLVYARLKVALQTAAHCKPYVRERRASARARVRPVHWVGLGA